MDTAQLSQLSEVQPLHHTVEPSLAERLQRLESQVLELTRIQLAVRATSPPAMALIVCSGDLDKLMAAFTLAVSAAATGIRVDMFFAFWAVLALRRITTFKGKGLLERIMTLLLPSGQKGLGTSKMNCFGAGPRLLRFAMRRHGMPCLQELMSTASELGVRRVICEASMEVMGVGRGEMIAGLEYGGATSFLDRALEAQVTLFI